MAARDLSVLFAIAAPSMFREAAAPVKAGDPAPNLTGTANSSTKEFSRGLEDGRHGPILDETGWSGVYDFKIQREARNAEEFLGILRDPSGLVLTPSRRSIEITVIRPVK